MECVAFFFSTTKVLKAMTLVQKNKFRCCVDPSQWGSVVKLREHVR